MKANRSGIARVFVQGPAYPALRELADQTGRPMSQIVEALILSADTASVHRAIAKTHRLAADTERPARRLYATAS